MTSPSDELLAASEAWAAAFAHGELEAPAGRRLAVVTCMDARIEPLGLLGLGLGDAQVLRNAGAHVTDDVLRSLAVAASLLGTEEAAVIGHTDCGLGRTTNEELRGRVGDAATGVDFLPFEDVEEVVRAGVARILASPLLPAGFRARGYVYDVRSGRLAPVEPGYTGPSDAAA